MKLLREIEEQDIHFYKEYQQEICYRMRKASRAIVKNPAGKIALLDVTKDHYHKLPGGGIEVGEDQQIALQREVAEEVGVQANVLGEVGLIIEYRSDHSLLQISYCYVTEMYGEYAETAFTPEEINRGFKLKWVNLDEAIAILTRDEPTNYVGRFIRERDLTFLQTYKKSFRESNEYNQ